MAQLSNSSLDNLFRNTITNIKLSKPANIGSHKTPILISSSSNTIKLTNIVYITITYAIANKYIGLNPFFPLLLITFPLMSLYQFSNINFHLQLTAIKPF